MDIVPTYGIAKTQKLPYSYWNQLREVETKDQLVDFFIQNSDFFHEFLSKRTSSGKVEDIFENQKIKKNSEFDYLSEAAKSAIFRAGGSNIMDWGCWYVADGSIITTPITESGVNSVDVCGLSVELPLGYKIALPSQLYEDIRDATREIHTMVRSQTDGPKILSRVDFVLTDEDKAYIVDIGESNTTLCLADALYSLSGLGEGMLLNQYLQRLFEEQAKINPNIKEVILVAEDQKMINNLPYEFQTMELLIREKFDIPVKTILKEELMDSEVAEDKFSAYIRCFRGIIPESEHDFRMVDDISAIDVYSKDNLYQILEVLKDDLPQNIMVPNHHLFRLDETEPDILAEKIYQQAEEANLHDFVVKPSIKSKKSSSLAYLYSIENSVHPRQLEKTIRRLRKEEHIPYLILEENVGAGVADGKKLEVRVHCLSN